MAKTEVIIEIVFQSSLCRATMCRSLTNYNFYSIIFMILYRMKEIQVIQCYELVNANASGLC